MKMAEAGRNLRVWMVAALLAASLAVGTAMADKRVTTPGAGSNERKLIMNAARVPVEADLGQPVLFKVLVLRVSSEWALVVGRPTKPNGTAIDYSKTGYADRVKNRDFEDQAAVLLVRNGNGWRDVTYSIGFTDVVWDSWDEEFGAPAWLWP